MASTDEYNLPLRETTLAFQVLDVLRANPDRYLNKEYVLKALPRTSRAWKPNSVIDALARIENQGGPCQRIGRGIYTYRPDRDSLDWGLNRPKSDPASAAPEDEDAVLYYLLGTTKDGESIVQDEDGKVGFVRWVA